LIEIETAVCCDISVVTAVNNRFNRPIVVHVVADLAVRAPGWLDNRPRWVVRILDLSSMMKTSIDPAGRIGGEKEEDVEK
jgi:hypothetical protein